MIRTNLGKVIGVFFLLQQLSHAVAAPPSLTYLYPAGVKAGTMVEVTAKGSLDPWPSTLTFNDRRLTAKPGDKKGTFVIHAAPDTTPGLYWCRAISTEGVSNPRPFLVGSFPEILESQVNDAPATAPDVALPAVVNGKLEKPGDVDCYKVALQRGQTLVAALNAHRSLKSPMDAILQVTSPSGFVLRQNHDRDGLDPRLEWTAPQDGEVVVRVFAFPAMPDSSIRFMGAEDYVYRLTLTTGGYAEHPWPLAVNRHQPVPVTLMGPNLSNGTPRIVVPKGLTESERVLTIPDVANAVSLGLESIPCLTADALPPGLAPPFLISAQFQQAQQTIIIPFHGKKGVRYTITGESRALGYPSMLMLRLLDSEGMQLLRVEPNKVDADPSTVFVPKADGVYRLVVHELFGAGGAGFVFRIRITAAEPDFEATLPTDRITVSPGKPTDIALTLSGINTYNSEVEVVAENLPAGVTMTVGTVAKKGATRTISLQFQAKNPIAAAPFQIVVRSITGPKIVRYVTTKVAELDQPLRELWIVAPPPSAAKPAPKSKN